MEHLQSICSSSQCRLHLHVHNASVVPADACIGPHFFPNHSLPHGSKPTWGYSSDVDKTRTVVSINDGTNGCSGQIRNDNGARMDLPAGPKPMKIPPTGTFS